MEHNIRVLLVEDTQAIATEVYDFLEDQGMVVDYAATGRQGVALALQAPYDVVVLDVMLPDISGIEVCQLIKRQCDPEPPVIMLTARDSIEDKSHGFEAGADDYLTKPFALVELHLRCKALARRQQLHLSQETTIGDLVVNEKQQTVLRQNTPLKNESDRLRDPDVVSQSLPQCCQQAAGGLQDLGGRITRQRCVAFPHLYLATSVGQAIRAAYIKNHSRHWL